MKSWLRRGSMALVASLALGGNAGAVDSTVLEEQLGGPAPAVEEAPSATILEDRFIVSRMRSYEGTTGNATTVVSVTNLNDTTCSVDVLYFAALSGTPSCTVSLPVSPGLTFQSCSRGGIGVGDFANCLFTCSPALTNTVGRAIVRTPEGDACTKLAVNGAIVHGDDTDSFVFDTERVTVVDLSFPIFSDGFEDGDTAAWDSTSPVR